LAARINRHKPITGIFYVGQQEPRAFCTISDSRIHDPTAVWEYLKPFLAHLNQEFPAVKTLHVFYRWTCHKAQAKEKLLLIQHIAAELQFSNLEFWGGIPWEGPR